MIGPGSVLHLAAGNLRSNWARSAATAGTILLAVTAFVVLTVSAQTSKLVTTGTVNSNFRAAYDILVRPQGSQTPEEQASARVRPNYLSGLFGGITLGQVQQIRAVPGVQLAAPVAMIGEVLQTVDLPVDVTAAAGSSGPMLLRFTSQVTSMRGLATSTGWAGYVYVGDGISLSLNGTEPSVQQVDSTGQAVTVCAAPPNTISSPLEPAAMFAAQCWDRRSGQSGQNWPNGAGRFYAHVPASFPVMLAAVDPDAENQLTGLTTAITSGSPLSATDTTRPGDAPDRITVPVLATSRTFVDETISIRVEKLPAATAQAIAGGTTAEQARATVSAAPGSPVTAATFTAQQAHDLWRSGSAALGAGSIYPRMLFQPSPVTYQGNPSATLTPTTHPFDPNVWRVPGLIGEPFAALPVAASDTSYRTITAIPAKPGLRVALQPVGSFDPSKLTSQSALTEVPLETYQPPTAEAANQATAKMLGQQPLLPDSNPGGYLQSPPLLLTTLNALPAFTDPNNFDLPSSSRLRDAPVSAVRIRVAGVTGADELSRERIRLAAEQIQQATGLAVDITAGSSPAPTAVDLPATTHGAPALQLSERWAQKGVAATIISAIDTKSLTLFLLILASTALAVAISSHASVRARRTQLGVLACVGWRPRTLLREVMAELTILGLTGGAAGALLSWPVAGALGIDIPPGRALLAIPAAIALAWVAGLAPAAAAARADPITAVRPAVSTRPRWTLPLRGTASMAANSLARNPGRLAAAAASLAVGVTTLAILAGITASFQGAVVGSLLGDAVSIQVRGADVAAAVLLTVIGLACLADLLYLDIREHGAAYATLQATGWRERTLGSLIIWQALIIGGCGATAGVGASLLLLAAVTDINSAALQATLAVGAGAVICAVIVAVLPALSLRRLPTARLLTIE